MKKQLTLFYGFAAYAIFAGCAVAAVGFIGGLYGKTIDSGPSASPWIGALVDTVLIAAFALHHSIAARERFKAWLSERIPPAVERSTYVLTASALFLLLIWQWRPIPGTVWDAQEEELRLAIQALYAGGWLLVLASTFAIDHLELFGLSQVLRAWRNRLPQASVFRVPFLYRFVRHPMHAGMLVVLWAAPTMSMGHLLFAVLMTLYVVAGSELEERDLVRRFGDAYSRYRLETPRLVPSPRLRARHAGLDQPNRR